MTSPTTVQNWVPGSEGDPRRYRTLLVLCLSLFMVVLGNTVLNIAIPRIIHDLHATSQEVQWMVDAYGLVFAGLLFTGGALGDRFGRKGWLNVGLCVFAAGSTIAAFGGETSTIIIGRTVMGIGAALVMPSTLSILTNVFPPQERPKAIGIWAGVAGAGGAIGPIISGFLLEHFWWGSIFLLNLPVVALALVGGAALVPTSRDPEHAALDIPGAALSIGAIGSLVYAIIEAPRYGWTDTHTLGWFAAAVVFGALFGWRERSTSAPMLDLAYFRRRGFSGGSIAISMMFFGMFGTFFLLTQYLQQVRGWSPLESGFRTLPFAVMLMVVAPRSAGLTARFGTRRVVTTGISVTASGLLLLSFADIGTAYWYIAGSLAVMASGMGCVMAPSTVSIMSALPLSKAGVGSAMNDTNRELGGAVGVAVLGSILASRYDAAIAEHLQGAPAQFASVVRQSLGGALQIAARVGRPELAAFARSAFVDGMALALKVGAAVALSAAVIVWFVMPDHVGPSEAQARSGAAETDD